MSEWAPRVGGDGDGDGNDVVCADVSCRDPRACLGWMVGEEREREREREIWRVYYLLLRVSSGAKWGGQDGSSFSLPVQLLDDPLVLASAQEIQRRHTHTQTRGRMEGGIRGSNYYRYNDTTKKSSNDSTRTNTAQYTHTHIPHIPPARRYANATPPLHKTHSREGNAPRDITPPLAPHSPRSPSQPVTISVSAAHPLPGPPARGSHPTAHTQACTSADTYTAPPHPPPHPHPHSSSPFPLPLPLPLPPRPRQASDRPCTSPRGSGAGPRACPCRCMLISARAAMEMGTGCLLIGVGVGRRDGASRRPGTAAPSSSDR